MYDRKKEVPFTIKKEPNGKKNRGRQRRLALPALVDLYLLRCQVEGKSPNTIRAYRETLGRFLRIAE